MRQDHEGLSPLDPRSDPRDWERLVSRITRAAAAELERRRVSVSPLLLLSQWRRPTLALAASIAVLAASAFLMPRPNPGTDAIAVGFGAHVVLEEWLVTGETPWADELVYAFEGGSR